MKHIILLSFCVLALTLLARPRSITDPDYVGKKYYVGFGDQLSGSMGNEVKYDVAHTHDIFTESIGGNYIGKKVIGKAQELRDYWKQLGDMMTWNDMFIQYSSGHGSHSGLAFGVSYDAIRDNALAYPAKEVIVFIMSCYSGNLVESFNKKKDLWKDWQVNGRTLFVLASSKPSEESSTGPGTDSDEPNGPSGSAGSAFGHALWKALIGYADANKDGLLTLGEIETYTIKRTKEVGGHTPVVTGTYSPDLVMAKVPPKEWVDSLLSTEGLSDEEITQRVLEMDNTLELDSTP